MNEKDKPDVCWSSVSARDAAHVVIARAQALVHLRGQGTTFMYDAADAATALEAAVEALDAINENVRRANGELE